MPGRVRTELEEQLLGMRNDAEQVVEVSVDHEIEAPAPIHPGLPDVSGIVVLLGSERRMAQILHQETQLLVAARLNVGRSARIAPAEALGVEEAHL